MLNKLSPYPLWIALSILPIIWLWQAATSTNPRIIHILVHPTGEFSARLLIVTLMITPLAMIFKGAAFTRWLRQNRRYFGVAAFAYAALHTVFYLIYKSTLDRVMSELPRFYIWTGWVAIAIFIPLAVTSMDYFLRVMGPRWKSLQRWTYAAAVLTLVHWASLHNWGHPASALVHFAPLAALEAWRLRRWLSRHKTPAPA